MSFENPYQAPLAAVADQYNDDALEAADRGTRLVAAIIDAVLGLGLIGIAAALLIPALLASRKNGGVDSGSLAIVAFVVVVGFLVMAIWNIVWLYKYGQSIGKRVMKIRIVRNDATRASLPRLLFLRILVPSFIGAIPFIGRIFSLVDACFIFRDDRRCIHDILADTVVVKA